jgi:hypothetical protein
MRTLGNIMKPSDGMGGNRGRNYDYYDYGPG